MAAMNRREKIYNFEVQLYNNSIGDADMRDKKLKCAKVLIKS